MSEAGRSLLEASRATVLPTYARADVTIVRGEGCRVWDDEGSSYLDFVGGIAVVGLGHLHPAVTAAAHAQLDRLWHASNLYWTEPMLRLAGLLSERMGGAQAFFCNSGAEANEAALKVARKATGRTRIVALEGGFHGRTLGALSATGQPGKWEGFGPLVPGVSFARPNDVESLEAAVAPASELATILLEPVLGEGGVLPLEAEFVRSAAEIAREVGALLTVDEVQAGLGRTGTFFAYEQLGIEPDLVTLAKGLGNGLPIGALLAREGVAEAIGPGDHGSTFGGNPVASAAACAVVEAIDDALLENVAARGKQLATGLSELGAVREVRGRGLLLAGVLDGDAGAVVEACRERGLLVVTAGPDVLRLLPPLVVSEAEVEEALAVLREVLS
ncbi:MAG TPA: acetylornithine transaminase [Gaiella sp.]|uniref:acetylornithine transaminase n=1 Tax=Gaiella sp. TaxID=2663207 RepID=UPI002D80FC33|nr:acetylornithine transaminase [Gaiella sp.]HET9285953.1 acetylornithine transaminase [Gaiella sp.]